MGSQVFGPAVLAIGDGTTQLGCLRVENGRIASIEDRSQRPDHTLAPGSILTPGLIDLHTNGTGRLWFNREPLETLAAMASDAPTHGVTSFLPSIMTGSWDLMLHAARSISECINTPAEGARPLGVHFEGPFLNPEYRRAHPKEFLLAPSPARIEALLETWKAGRLRVTMAPELEDAPLAAAELARRGVTLAAGHTAATYAIGNSAIECGYQILTHAFNGMPPLHHRVSSILTAFLLDPTAFCEVIADGVHVSVEHLALLYRLKGLNLVLTTDAMPLVNGLVEEGGVARTKDGVIAGSRLALDQAVRNLVAATGISLAEAIQCATWAPARAMGLENEIGVLAPGLRADFVSWNARNEVTHVFIAGRLVYSNN
ncbi:MAG: amidohydrolase family protein [Candidatus Eremiobacteraeota bacterium]|nr:amidohydrolase family protein [Candidatus Eremiobacteraeota bacterium]